MSESVPRELTGPQLKAVAALVAAPDIKAAAAEAGVARSTLHRWLEDAAFRAELARARETIFSETMAELQAATSASVRVLHELLRSRHEGIRLRAALGVISMGLKAREVVELGERVRRLEEVVGGGN